MKSESATGDGSASGECCATSAVGEDGEGVATGEGGASGDGGAIGETNVSGDGAGGEGGTADSERRTAVEAPPTIQQSSKITWQSLEPEWRRFNFDLLPKGSYVMDSVCIVWSSFGGGSFWKSCAPLHWEESKPITIHAPFNLKWKPHCVCVCCV